MKGYLKSPLRALFHDHIQSTYQLGTKQLEYNRIEMLLCVMDKFGLEKVCSFAAGKEKPLSIKPTHTLNSPAVVFRLPLKSRRAMVYPFDLVEVVKLPCP